MNHYASTEPITSAPPIGYDTENQCRACGEHISDPHAAGCPAEIAAQLRQQAERSDLTCIQADTPAEFSHRFIAAAQRVAADLLEADRADIIELDAWPVAAEFIAYLTGEATDQWGGNDPIDSQPTLIDQPEAELA